jgi:hypothetical protein
MFISLPAVVASLTFPGKRTTIFAVWILGLVVLIVIGFALRLWRQPTASDSFGTYYADGSRSASRPADLTKLERIVRDGYDVREFDSRIRPVILALAQQRAGEHVGRPGETLPLLMSGSLTADIYGGRVSLEDLEALLDQLEEAVK